MVDPLSLISLASDVIATCYSYGCGVAGAPEEARKLTAEITNLSGVLVGVAGVAHLVNVNIGSINLDAMLSDCHNTLLAISLRISGISSSELVKAKRLIKRAMWPLKKQDTMELLQDVERQKATFIMALQTFTAQAISDQQSLLGDVASKMASIDLGLKSSIDTDRQQRIFKWLSDYDFEAQHLRASELRCRNTCSWIVEDSRFKKWLSEKFSLLWFHGIAGSGKTVLTSFVVDYLQMLMSEKGTTDELSMIVYFYFDASTNQSISVETLAGSTLAQICSRFRDIPAVVVNAFEQATDHSGRVRPASGQQLRVLLKEVLKLLHRCFLVIDGLDEASDPIAACEFVNQFTALEDCAVHTFVTGRPEAVIRRSLCMTGELSAQEYLIRADILLYIQNRMGSELRLQRMSDQAKQLVRQSLTLNASGMFRWVQCQMDAISKMRTENAVISALSTLPKTIEATYDRILLKIDENDVLYARRAFLWLTAGLYPLPLHALAEAVILEPGFSTIKPETRLGDPDDILEICGSLISFNGVSDEVRLAHHSVREYLSQSLRPESPFFLPSKASHRELAETCLSYLLMQDFDSGPVKISEFASLWSRYRLLSYAAKNWISHVLESDAERELQPLILKLLTPKPNRHFLFWLQVVLMHSSHGFAIPGQGSQNSPEPLYYAASYGLYETTQSLITAGADLNSRSGQFGGTAYHAACWRQHPQIVKLLLEAGVDTTIRDSNSMTAFDLIEYTGFTDVAEVALQYNAGVTVNDMVEGALKGLYQKPIETQKDLAPQVHWRCCKCQSGPHVFPSGICVADGSSCHHRICRDCLRFYAVTPMISTSRAFQQHSKAAPGRKPRKEFREPHKGEIFEL